jgi:hypothetical protein
VIFSTTARTDRDGVVAAFKRGHQVKVFKHSSGWSVECNAGLLSNSGTDVVKELEPLVQTLKEAGVDRLLLEP